MCPVKSFARILPTVRTPPTAGCLFTQAKQIKFYCNLVLDRGKILLQLQYEDI